MTFHSKRKHFIFIFILVFSSLFLMQIIAGATTFHDLDINVVLNDDGSARIREQREITPTQGSENFVTFADMGNMEMKDINITDESGIEYEYLDDWSFSSNASIEELRVAKEHKFGIINYGSSFELCWGVGDYSQHTYYIDYTLTNFVKSMMDYDAFNHQFFEGSDLTPKEINLTVEIPGQKLTPVDENSENGNTAVWSFGYQGTINVEEDRIIAHSKGNIDYFTVMTRFDKGMLHPTSIDDRDFESMKADASVDSEYLNNSSWSFPTSKPTTFITSAVFLLVIVLLPMIFIIILVVAIINIIRLLSSKSHFKVKLIENKRPKTVALSKKEIDYSRNIPFDGDLNISRYVYYNSSYYGIKKTTFFGAYILKWVFEGKVRILPEENEKNVSLIFDFPTIDSGSTVEDSVYELLYTASGDGTLKSKEMQKWSAKHYQIIDALNKQADSKATNTLTKNGCLIKSSKTSLLPVYTPQGFEKGKTLLGFKKYLEDFTIINERKPVEVELWNEYLIYATLFGIADEVEKNFKELYPEYFQSPAYTSYFGSSSYSTFILLNAFSNSIDRGYSSGRAADSYSGSGGFSSMGGGGGSSGGGGSGVR